MASRDMSCVEIMHRAKDGILNERLCNAEVA